MQNIQYKALIDAICQRHSVRAFLPKLLDQQSLSQLNNFISSLFLSFEHDTRLHFFKAASGKKMYSNGINLVDNSDLLSLTDLIFISKTGFVGELVMFYAVSIAAPMLSGLLCSC